MARRKKRQNNRRPRKRGKKRPKWLEPFKDKTLDTVFDVWSNPLILSSFGQEISNKPELLKPILNQLLSYILVKYRYDSAEHLDQWKRNVRTMLFNSFSYIVSMAPKHPNLDDLNAGAEILHTILCRTSIPAQRIFKILMLSISEFSASAMNQFEFEQI